MRTKSTKTIRFSLKYRRAFSFLSKQNCPPRSAFSRKFRSFTSIFREIFRDNFLFIKAKSPPKSAISRKFRSFTSVFSEVIRDYFPFIKAKSLAEKRVFPKIPLIYEHFP